MVVPIARIIVLISCAHVMRMPLNVPASFEQMGRAAALRAAPALSTSDRRILNTIVHSCDNAAWASQEASPPQHSDDVQRELDRIEHAVRFARGTRTLCRWASLAARRDLIKTRVHTCE